MRGDDGTTSWAVFRARDGRWYRMLWCMTTGPYDMSAGRYGGATGAGLGDGAAKATQLGAVDAFVSDGRAPARRP